MPFSRAVGPHMKMKVNWIVILFSCFFSLKGQVQENLQTITTYHKGTNKVFEEYEVSSDDSIKNGFYKLYSINRNLIAKGQYLEGNKIGIWDYYEDKSRESIWIRYDYDNSKELIYNTPTRTRYMKSNEVLHGQLDRFPGGSIVFNETLRKKLSQIDTSILPDSDSTIYITFSIAPEGNIYDLDVYYFRNDAWTRTRQREDTSVAIGETLNPLLIKAILDVFRSMPAWKPLTNNGKEYSDQMVIIPIGL